MTDTNSNKTATPETIAQTDALIAPTNEPAPVETLEQRMAKIEALLEEARQGNLKRPIEQEDGSTRDFKELQSEHRKFMDEIALEHEKAVRFLEEHQSRNPIPYSTQSGQLAWRPQGAVDKPLLDEDNAIKLFGLMKWANLTPQQKAQARTVTQRDVDAVDLPSVFGRTSSSKKAVELSSKSPVLYRLAKAKAVKEGIF